jgi:hypothetical protein
MNLTHAARFLTLSPKTLRIAAERGEIAAEHPLQEGLIYAHILLVMFESMTSGVSEMEPVEKFGFNDGYDVGDFGDSRLKKRRNSVRAHGARTNGLLATVSGKPST